MVPVGVEFHPLVSARCSRYGTSWSKRSNTQSGRIERKIPPMGCAGANTAQAHEQATEQRFCRRFELVSLVSFRWHDASEHYKEAYSTTLGLAVSLSIAPEFPPKV